MDEVINTKSVDRKELNGRFDVKQFIKKRIPVIGWLPSYNGRLFLHDLLAGFTVSLTEIPQGIAYAIVAGLPSQYGLYSGFMGAFTYFFLGSCSSLNIGPTAIMALMIQSHVAVLGPAAAALAAFLSGCVILLCGVVRLGFILVEFFSYPVIAGFTTAAALNIGSAQIKNLLGIKGKSSEFLGAWIKVFENITDTSKWDLILGICSIIFLVFAKEIRRFGSLERKPEWSPRRNVIGRCIFMFSLASNALVVIFGTSLAYIFHTHGSKPFKLTDKVESGLPAFSLPPFSTTVNGTEYTFADMTHNFGTMIAFCPLVAILEHIAIARVFSKGRTLDATQELIALGMCNVMSSLVSAMPVTGSFTRSAVNNASGAKTTLCGVITGTIVILALCFLTATFQYIPKTSLAAVIIVAMYYLCEFHAFAVLWKSKKMDLIPLTATLLCSLLISLEYGIIIGILINVLFILYSSARPKITIEETTNGVYVVQFKTGLYFPAAGYLKEFIVENCPKENCTIILNGKNVGNIDATVAKGFNDMQEQLTSLGKTIVFWDFKPSVIETCSGVNANMRTLFKGGSLKQVIECKQTNELLDALEGRDAYLLHSVHVG